MIELRRRAVMMGVPPPPYIPAEYQQVEYLENTSKSRIFIPDNIDIYNADIEIKYFSAKVNDAYIFSAYNRDYFLFYRHLNFSAILRPASLSIYGSYAVPQIAMITTRYPNVSMTILQGDTTFERSGSVSIEQQEQQGYRLFGNPNTGSSFLGRIYYLKITNETKSYELIPCYRKSDLEPGMYDRVNYVFYTNTGTGSFIVGPDVT